ncbi:TIMELESS-interacting protein isoform 1 [Schistosoma japonicum]|uniref:TIMELESS-interacting protein n=1 Tax=Schistosoma japonicum TaxID=6182 RepID=A0A4Z2D8J3_SCHJA|nr:TIMELESS-interacting protein isoform 1 [Schistosoma japonicum]TNN12815.1 TIMELESS-interacting protein isoform 1 [Schistosoma japonicum]
MTDGSKETLKISASHVLSSTRISEFNDSSVSCSSKVEKPRHRLRIVLDDEHDISDKENNFTDVNVSTQLPTSIHAITSARIPRVDVSSSSEDERRFSDESEQGSNSDVTENEAESILSGDDDSNDSRRRKNGLKHSSKLRAYSRNKDHEASSRHNANSPQNLPSVADDDAVDIGVLEKLRKMSKGAAKRVVKNPRPKLDPQRLLSNKGLPALLSDFKKVKFRGKGFEFQDLDRLLFTYEAWSNRLVPRMSFPEVVDRLEAVGNKREIRVALHKLRNGIWPPYASEEQVIPSSDDEKNTSEQEDPDLVWKRALESHPETTLKSAKSSHKASDVLEERDHRKTQDLTDGFSIQSPQPSTSFTDSESRAERNKRLALERLAARRSSSGIINNEKLCTLFRHLELSFICYIDKH